eukprot:m.1513490 g.1513490  ORF g.1513490 m.1513490 type:complete len:244 (+) comp25214_c0_seq22:1268-1999(+)
MPTFYPWFIYGVTTLQVIVALLMVAHAYTAGHMADLGIVSKTTLCTGDECPAGFNGLVNTAANRTDEFNWYYIVCTHAWTGKWYSCWWSLWGLDETATVGKRSVAWTNVVCWCRAYGPTASYLLQAGAKYSMCMRESTEVLLSASRERGQQCVFGISDDSDVGYRCDDSAPGNAGERGYACCKTGIARYDCAWACLLVVDYNGNVQRAELCDSRDVLQKFEISKLDNTQCVIRVTHDSLSKEF